MVTELQPWHHVHEGPIGQRKARAKPRVCERGPLRDLAEGCAAHRRPSLWPPSSGRHLMSTLVTALQLLEP